MRTQPLLAVAGCAVALSGCGGGAAAGSSSGGPPSRTSATTRARRHRPLPGGNRHPAGAAPLGHTQRVHAGDATLAVTITRVYGSLADSGAALAPRTRAAGVRVTIRNEAGATYDSKASGDVSLVTSSSAAAPLFIPRGVCQTQLTDFESLIGIGETRSGCVGFAVPHGVRILGVRFSPHSRPPGSVTWR